MGSGFPFWIDWRFSSQGYCVVPWFACLRGDKGLQEPRPFEGGLMFGGLFRREVAATRAVVGDGCAQFPVTIHAARRAHVLLQFPASILHAERLF